MRADLRGGRFLPQELRLLGEADSIHIRPENEGLRLTLPAAGAEHRPTGVIYAAVDSPSKDAVSIGWFRRSKQHTAFVAHQARDGPDGKRRHSIHAADAKRSAGKLRLARHGDVASFSVADGLEQEFFEIWRRKDVSGDVSIVRFAVDSGGAQVPVDVRLHAVAISADGFVSRNSTRRPSLQATLLILGFACIASTTSG
ncbi:MAG: hypothetical protein ACREHD_27350 [Pirellulales bacterium]